jgi:uncharacterized protein (TIRG00374 family)
MTKGHWRFLTLLLWLLAITLATWTLSQLPFGDIASRLGLLAPGDWLLWLLINLVILYLAVRRWQLLGQALESPLSLIWLFRLRQAGSAVSFLTPGPHFGGEPLQLYWLHNRCRLPLHRAVAMLGLDRFMETGTNIAVLLAGVMILLGTTLLPLGDWLQVSAILAVVLTVMLVIAALVLRHPVWLAERFRPLAQRWRRDDEPAGQESGWLALVELLRNALARQRPRLWLALLLSLGGWAALLAELVLLLHLLGLTPSWQDTVLIMVGMRLAMLLPVPGGIGTIEASLFWSFRLLGLPVAAAGGLIALIRLRDAVVLVIGLGCLASFRRQHDAG